MRVYVIAPGADWATSDVFAGFVAGLRALDGVEVYEGRINTILSWYEVAINAGLQQQVWEPAIVDNRVFNRQRWASAHITQHILDVWPDVVICVSGHNYHLDDVKALRRVGLKTAVLLTESPYFFDLEKILVDVYGIAFTNERKCAAALGAHYLPHAYHPTRHTAHGPVEPGADALFVGSLFEERKRLLFDADWSGMQFVWHGHDLSETTTDVIPNERAAALYRGSKVNINTHRTTTSVGGGAHIAAGDAESLNPRAYEVPACGGFFLSDDSRAELWDVYGESAVTYRAGDSADLVKQCRYWLARPDARARIAKAQHDAVQPHSWSVRAQQVLETII